MVAKTKTQTRNLVEVMRDSLLQEINDKELHATPPKKVVLRNKNSGFAYVPGTVHITEDNQLEIEAYSQGVPVTEGSTTFIPHDEISDYEIAII